MGGLFGGFLCVTISRAPRPSSAWTGILVVMQVAQKQTHGCHSEARNDNSLGIFKLHHYGDFLRVGQFSSRRDSRSPPQQKLGRGTLWSLGRTHTLASYFNPFTTYACDSA